MMFSFIVFCVAESAYIIFLFDRVRFVAFVISTQVKKTFARAFDTLIIFI